MSTFPGSPRLARGGLVVLDALTGAVQRIITLQYNPDSVTRSLQAKGATGDTNDPGEALRLSGPPTETLTPSGVRTRSTVGTRGLGTDVSS